MKNVRNINGAPTSVVQRCSAILQRYSAKPLSSELRDSVTFSFGVRFE
ncbi:uncharacterized protein G2W53_022246 [Senna tora]|uniref:Uncharacterized protein n=1 Tax=Senna tora TaxID=362788 RepID=A0A834TMC8_9FABA|nr:uncharacterized protein G2W53_022246 [Senna tora]